MTTGGLLEEPQLLPRVGQSHTYIRTYVRCYTRYFQQGKYIYGIGSNNGIGLAETVHTVVYGVHKRLWPKP